MNFSVRTVLTITTGRLLTESSDPKDNGIGDVYKILSHMVGYSAFTHQLPRIGKEAAPVLLEQFPELGNVDLDALDAALKPVEGDRARVEEVIAAWAATEIARGLAPDYEIEPLTNPEPPRDPLGELIEMVGPEKVIVVTMPEEKKHE